MAKSRDLRSKIQGLSEKKHAKQVCVFMICGLNSNWKHVLGYAATKNGITNKSLVKLIKIYIKQAFDIGLHIRATVCDQGSNNRTAYNKKVNVTINSPFVYIADKQIFALYYTPHLIK